MKCSAVYFEERSVEAMEWERRGGSQLCPHFSTELRYTTNTNTTDTTSIDITNTNKTDSTDTNTNNSTNITNTTNTTDSFS